MTGRNAPDWVAAFKRNRWPDWAGIRTHSFCFIEEMKNSQDENLAYTAVAVFHIIINLLTLPLLFVLTKAIFKVSIAFMPNQFLKNKINNSPIIFTQSAIACLHG
jgi:hypothetical protein